MKPLPMRTYADYMTAFAECIAQDKRTREGDLSSAFTEAVGYGRGRLDERGTGAYDCVAFAASYALGSLNLFDAWESYLAQTDNTLKG